MPRNLTLLPAALLLAAGLQGATTSTTLTAHLTAALSGANVAVTGTVNLPPLGNGTVTESLSLISLVGATGNTVTLPLPVVLSGGTLNIALTLPAALLTSGDGPINGSGTVNATASTGSYAGATGSFPTLTGAATGSILTPGGSITMDFSGAGSVTTGGSGGPTSTTPAVTAVQDAGSYTSKIAPGSIFVVKGTNLSVSGYTAFPFPLPTQSTGSDKAQITFTPTSGGTGTQAYLIYTFNQNGVNQLAAILPSSVTPGSYNVTVTSGGATSSPVQVTVVKQKPELFTGDASGSGLVLAQNVVSATQYDINRLTKGTVAGYTISPAYPGETLVGYATGLGAVTGGDNVGSAGFDFSTSNSINVVVGGKTIPVLYAGRTPTLAGLDQINFTLPSDVTTGCTVSFQISENGVLSAATYIAIAPNSSAAACVQPGFTTQQLQDLDNGKAITTGAFTLTQLGTSFQGQTFKSNSVAGGFNQITGFQLGSASQLNTSSTTSGSCTVTHVTGTSSALGGGTASGLDAGNVTFGGTGISTLALTEDAGTKSYSLPASAIASLNIGAGTYTITGAGGNDVGAFNASLTLGTPLNIPTLPSTVNRNSNLVINWTGGNSSDPVQIVGYSGTSTGTGTTASIDATEFVCLTTAGPGTFTVPSAILSQLPATGTSPNAVGFLEVISGPLPTTFTAPLKAGGSITNATFSALAGAGGQAIYQ